MATLLQEKKTVGDIFRHKYAYDTYLGGGAKVYNRSGGAITINDPMGYPLIADGADFAFAKLTDEADVVALFVPGMGFAKKVDALADDGYVLTNVIVRGPAIVDLTQLPTLDYAGGTFVKATIATALAALNPPILAFVEHVQTATQTT